MTKKNEKSGKCLTSPFHVNFYGSIRIIRQNDGFCEKRNVICQPAHPAKREHQEHQGECVQWRLRRLWLLKL